MAQHIAEPTPDALWAESCEARHTAGSEQAAGRHDNAVLINLEADMLLDYAKREAASQGLARLKRRVTHRPQHARYPLRLGQPVPAPLSI